MQHQGSDGRQPDLECIAAYEICVHYHISHRSKFTRLYACELLKLRLSNFSCDFFWSSVKSWSIESLVDGYPISGELPEDVVCNAILGIDINCLYSCELPKSRLSYAFDDRFVWNSCRKLVAPIMSRTGSWLWTNSPVLWYLTYWSDIGTVSILHEKFVINYK